MDIGIAGAFVGGVLTLLSPCSVVLLPAFFAYAFTSPGRVLARTGIFFLGLAATLVPLGVLAGTLGAAVSAHRGTVVAVTAGLVIALGLAQLIGIPLPGLSRSRATEGTGAASVFLLGTVYGLAGVCAGPLLGAVLALGAFGGNALYGALVLLVFAAGMTVPLVILALAWERTPAIRTLLRPRSLHVGRWRTTWTQLIGGVLTIGVGILLLVTDGTAGIAAVLDAASQADLEAQAMTATASLPDLVAAGVGLAVLLTVWLVHRAVSAKRAESARAPSAP